MDNQFIYVGTQSDKNINNIYSTIKEMLLKEQDILIECANCRNNLF